MAAVGGDEQSTAGALRVAVDTDAGEVDCVFVVVTALVAVPVVEKSVGLSLSLSQISSTEEHDLVAWLVDWREVPVDLQCRSSVHEQGQA